MVSKLVGQLLPTTTPAVFKCGPREQRPVVGCAPSRGTAWHLVADSDIQAFGLAERCRVAQDRGPVARRISRGDGWPIGDVVCRLGVARRWSDSRPARQLELYGQFVGDWDADIVTHTADGVAHRGQGEIHFGWLLEGRAIHWMIPMRKDRVSDAPLLCRSPGIGMGQRYGLTIPASMHRAFAESIRRQMRIASKSASAREPISSKTGRPRPEPYRVGASPRSRHGRFTGKAKPPLIREIHGDLSSKCSRNKPQIPVVETNVATVKRDCHEYQPS